jgi:predicted Zn finger-like uncharacterized protein
MRLVCPNCGAQYEVPDDVIPENGRDVQCSNCGDTWFQKHPSQDRELAEELGQPLDDVHWQETEDAAPAAPTPDEEIAAEVEPEPAPEPEPEPEPEEVAAEAEEAAPEDDPADQGDHWQEHVPDTSEPEAESESDWGEPEEDDAPAAPDEEAPAVQPSELPDEVRDVLREEAQFEARARAEEAGGLETQPDLGLEELDDEASRREREARERMARMRGQSPEEAAGGGAAAQAMRRDLLPDIDEINSTLRKDSERVSSMENNAQVAPAQPKRGGFSRGFLTVIVLFTILVLVYVFAGKIAESVPALRAPLETYVALVNDLRAWIDAKVLALLGWLDGLSSEAPPSGQN